MEGLRPELEPMLAEQGIDWEQAVTMVIRAGTLPVSIQTGGVMGDKKGMDEVNLLARDPQVGISLSPSPSRLFFSSLSLSHCPPAVKQAFAHGFIATTGANTKRFMPRTFQKQVDA